MSFDPYPPPELLRPPSAEGEAPEWARQQMRERVTMPATLLSGIGLLNLLVALLWGAMAVHVSLMPADRFQSEGRKGIETNPWFDAAMKKQLLEEMEKKTPEQLQRQGVLQSGLSAAVLILCGLLALVGGVQMMRLRRYGWAVLGAVVVAIPCLSPCACCGIGELTGLWALFVLLQADVRSAFQ